jgi:magnesium-dependent phosphatase 1
VTKLHRQMLDGITRFPRVLIFDLDDTLWLGEVDCSGGPPFRAIDTHTTNCSRNRPVRLFTEVPEIFSHIVRTDMHVAYASRTWEPEWAKQALHELGMWDICTAHGWGDCGKSHHLREIKSTLGIDYSEMMFFDNEQRS